ncbi:MAG: DNA topoisomerase VI subunit B [Thermoplasmata archaeon]|nr:DNA topoisomerase VI subunit B [Thermoplasmatales archaeon]PMP74408.1 MAG: DNA topoisomerase VI subunit B [Aciduliprofundum sp.]HEU12993.1 DNA topoisomerase VI subunit B [Euryarchaeota archaeon]
MDIAEELAKKQKEISVAEFFEKNKQILGFDSPQKSLVMAVKEAVDNSLDACEEARILPEIHVDITKVDRDEYQLTVEDNGPGIVRREVPKVFGQFLYGSRFHSVKQTRGQQGIGISAVVLYSQLTTGKPARIVSKISSDDVAYYFEIMIDTLKNRANVLREEPLISDKKSGVKIQVNLKGKYTRGKQSVLEYLQNTAIVNPHATIVFSDPEGLKVRFERAWNNPIEPPKETKPHPLGVEIGELMQMVSRTSAKKLKTFLTGEFSRISDHLAQEICRISGIECERDPHSLSLDELKRIQESFRKVKILPPTFESLSPIGETLIKKGLKNVLGNLKPSFYSIPVTRKPSVYSGNPFVVEVGLVYGGSIPHDEQVKVLRFANRVPLLYQAGSCALTKAVENIDWRKYGLEQRGGQGLPVGPMIVLIHLGSTRIPYTSEAKEAVAEIPEIMDELDLALKESARQIKAFLIKKEVKAKLTEKFFLVQKILPKIAEKSSRILNKEIPPLDPVITKIMNVLWIEENVSQEGKSARINVNVSNFTPEEKSFRLYADLPDGKLDGNIIPYGEYDENKDYIRWNIESMKPMEKITFTFNVKDLKGDYGETVFYIEGTDPVHVVGAEPLPGDWNLEALRSIIEEEEEEENGEE